MDTARKLIIVADDFGLGPATSEGILELAGLGRISATVLLVNSPFAEQAVRQWHRAGGANLVKLGWHVCLTLDRPVLPPRRVPSLVHPDGTFLSLGQLLHRLAAGQVVRSQVRDELQAQYERFQQWTGYLPPVINGHHHVHVLPHIRHVLLDVLRGQRPQPYVRRVVESAAMLRTETRARGKRLFLGTLGRRCIPMLNQAGLPGNDALAGITDPQGLAFPDLDHASQAVCRWLTAARGQLVELMCHPGFLDDTARRCDPPSLLSKLLARWLPGLAVACGPEVREREWRLLAESTLLDQTSAVGFRMIGAQRGLWNETMVERQAA